jgi:hypothetical protein
MWWNPFTVEHMTLGTSLTPAECTGRIQAHIYCSLWALRNGQDSDPTRPFAGVVRGNGFKLVKHTPRLSNWARPFLLGEVLLDPAGGSKICLRLSLHLVAYLIWIPILIAAGVPAVIGVESIGVTNLAVIVLVTLLMEMLFIGSILYPFYLLGAWLSSNEQGFLVRSVVTMLQAADYYSDLYIHLPGSSRSS